MQYCFYCQNVIENINESHEGLHQACFCLWFGVEKIDDFKGLIARNSGSCEDNFKDITTSFFHGKFRKYSARLGQNHYILKVQEPDIPELPKTEYLCNQLARHLGLMVPNHYLVKLRGELDTFVVENFMQFYPSSNLIHIYRFLDSPEQFSCEGLLNVIAKHVSRRIDLERFVTVCLFDALIGNHDRHGRNLALIQTKKRLELAPFYDNPSYLAIEIPFLLPAQHEPRGAIKTKTTNDPTMHDYVIEFQRLGFSDVINTFESKVNLSTINTIINQSFISQERKAAMIKLIEQRHKEMSYVQV